MLCIDASFRTYRASSFLVPRPYSTQIPVTEELGAYPPEQTVVLALASPLPNPRHRYSEGMKPLDNRNEIWRNYEAFKWAVDIV